MKIGIDSSADTSQIVTVNLPTWQSCDGEPVEAGSVVATIDRNGGYGGIAVTIGTLEIYIENDAERGICLRVWRDPDTEEEACIEEAFPLASIALKE